jgi:Fasciclin domain
LKLISTGIGKRDERLEFGKLSVAFLELIIGSTSLRASTDRISHGAEVTTADITACNGIIHVIDALMLPPKS